MYIRRKVFSVLDTEVGERLFSTTDYVLDQREYAEAPAAEEVKEGLLKRGKNYIKKQWNSGKMGKAKVIAVPVAATALTGGAIYGINKHRKNKRLREAEEAALNGEDNYVMD